MSYMREPVYVWSDGNFMHLWPREDMDDETYTNPSPEDIDGYPSFATGIAIRMDIFDAIVLFRFAQLAGDKKAMRRAVKSASEQSGNFGSFRFQEFIGRDPNGEFKRLMDEAIANREVTP